MNRPTATSPRLRPLVLACFFITAAAVPALDYALGPGDPTLQARRDIQRGIIDQTTRAPDRYRWLAPIIVEGPARLLGNWMPADAAYDRASTVFYLLAFTALLASLFAYLRLWFDDEAALIGTLVVACTIRITLRQHDYAPSSYLEAALFPLGLILIAKQRWIAFGVLVAVATLNRETAIFLIMLYVAASPWTRSTFARAAVYTAIWFAIFAATRIIGGDAERYWSIERVIRTNLSQPLLAAFNLTLFLGVFWWFAVRGFTAAPPFVRRTALIIPLYLATVAVWGIWWEVRLLMPLYPILIASGLAYLFPPRAAGAAA